MRHHLKRAILLSPLGTQRRLCYVVRAQGVPLDNSRLSAIVQGWVDPTPAQRQAIARVLGRSERGPLFDNEPDEIVLAAVPRDDDSYDAA